MKKITVLLLVLCLLCVGCGKKEEPGATYPAPPEPKPWRIGKTQLTDQQLERMQLAEAAETAYFQFTAAEEAGAAKFILFRLQDGSWEDIAGGNWDALSPDSWDAHGASSGALALNFDFLWQDPAYHALIGQNTEKGYLHPQADPEGKLSGLNVQTTFLSAVTEADWEQLVPLAVQAVSHQDRIYPPGLDIWDHPEAYESQGYEEVFLLAFSLKKSSYEPLVETFEP